MDDEVKNKIRQLYQFLKKANELRFKPVRLISEQKVIRFDEMPHHPSLQIQKPINTNVENDEIHNFVFRIKRPSLSQCPEPPAIIKDWLNPGYDEPTNQASVAATRNLLVTRKFDEDVRRIEDLATFQEKYAENPSEHPPDSLVQWLKEGWNNPESIPEVRSTLTLYEKINFDDDKDRVRFFESWKQIRQTWLEPELMARNAMSIYERLYEIYVTLEKEGESIELMVADGRLQWLADSEIEGQVKIDHPVLLKRVELNFNPKVPEFSVTDTDYPSELYSGLFVDLKNVLPTAIQNRVEELQTNPVHPAGLEGTGAFLRAFIQTISPTAGQYLESSTAGAMTATPRIFRDLTLLLRKRNQGIANAVDSILEAIEDREVFPPALAQITGSNNEWNLSGFGNGEKSSELKFTSFESEGKIETETDTFSTIPESGILLGKESNEEQLKIIKRLENSGSVIVQGPPGTGKTHTIGNLIGHLLAQGKSILVTAQTSKALRVVHEMIPNQLQNLAVSVLGSETKFRDQLESSVSSLSERINEKSESLLKKAEFFELERANLLSRKNLLQNKLRQALENEYREIYVSPFTFTPSEAANFIRDNKSEHSWIPLPVKLGAQLSLDQNEINRLYWLGTQFTPSEEELCQLALPDLTKIPDAKRFGLLVSEYNSLLSVDLNYCSNHWMNPSNGKSKILEEISVKLQQEFSIDLRNQTWRPNAIVAGQLGQTNKKLWTSLVENIEECNHCYNQYVLKLHHQPNVSKHKPFYIQKKIVVEIIQHLENGGKLNFLNFLTRFEWKEFIKESSVSAGQPAHREHFEALLHLINLNISREKLEPLWDTLVGSHINLTFASIPENPEQTCRAIVPEINRCLSWHEDSWIPIEKRLREEGLLIDEIIASIPREPSPVSDYLLIEKFATSFLPMILAAELARRKLRECEEGFHAIENLLMESAGNDYSENGSIAPIINSVRSRDALAYESSLARVNRLQSIKASVDERCMLLKKLAAVAPSWAKKIRLRIPPHETESAPKGIQNAWIWSQLCAELNERDKLNSNLIQAEIDQLETRLREVTLLLIDAKAWGLQLSRLQNNNTMWQALVGWLQTQQAIKSVRQEHRRQTLLAESRNLMKRCVKGIPVWIMPIAMVAENFDPRNISFDVVIIDEASQADLNALIPLFMGKQVIIVGDHEQVTPLGVGQGHAILENIRKQTLKNFPNAHLFDAKYSIYDIGRSSFGDTIQLVEHFRCVPEIIAFSNQLSYNGKIKPLRESNSSNLKPACISIKLNGYRDKDINKIEANYVVDLIKAMLEHSNYAGKTIGVIAMVGDQQSHLIQSLLLKEIPAKEIEDRRIIAGTPSEFQGDERDVILLSMVDSPQSSGPMRMTGEGAFELIKKRYNVAVSRAKDQLFVIHSFDPDIHLKSDDMRLRLLRHVSDPFASLKIFQQQVARTESPFERAVLKILAEAGYYVKTQWEVGYYRIDMVVEGGGKRLAVECDGDRFHPIEKLSDDIARQSILERLGWKFVRIRGSDFYRDSESAMKPVFDRLRELEIPAGLDVDSKNNTNNSLLAELQQIIAKNNLPLNPNLELHDQVSDKESPPLEIEIFPESSPRQHESDAEIEKVSSAKLIQSSPFKKISIKKNIRLVQYEFYDLHLNPNIQEIKNFEHYLKNTLEGILSKESPVEFLSVCKKIDNNLLKYFGSHNTPFDLRQFIPIGWEIIRDELGVEFFWRCNDTSEAGWDFDLVRIHSSDMSFKRTIYEIPIEEIANACKYILIKPIAFTNDKIISKVAKIFPVHRLEEMGKKRITAALQRLENLNLISYDNQLFTYSWKK